MNFKEEVGIISILIKGNRMKKKSYIYYIPIFIQSIFFIYLSLLILSVPGSVIDYKIKHVNLSLTGLLLVDIYFPWLYPLIMISPTFLNLIFFILYKKKHINERPKLILITILLMFMTIYIYINWGDFLRII